MKIVSPLLLLLTALIWGSAFLAQKLGSESLPPISFTILRSYLGAAFLFGALYVRNCLGPRPLRTTLRLLRGTRGSGSLCGLALFSATVFQQAGIQYTTPAISGFLTTFYVFLVPLFGLFLGQRPRLYLWFASVVALGALYLICEANPSQLGRGEILTLICAALYSVQMLLVGHYAPHCDVLALSVNQLASGAVCGTLLLTVPTLAQVAGLSLPNAFTPLAHELESLTAANLQSSLFALFYCGILSSGIAYTLQNYGQRGTPPALAALLLSLESLFALVLGYLILGDSLSPLQLTGCLLLFVTVCFTQLCDARSGR